MKFFAKIYLIILSSFEEKKIDKINPKSTKSDFGIIKVIEFF